MPLDAAVKQQIMTEYATGDGDTGSPEVQVALLTRRISDLTEHMKQHKHDFHTQRGLLLLVGRRRRMLRYLESMDVLRYREPDRATRSCAASQPAEPRAGRTTRAPVLGSGDTGSVLRASIDDRARTESARRANLNGGARDGHRQNTRPIPQKQSSSPRSASARSASKPGDSPSRPRAPWSPISTTTR